MAFDTVPSAYGMRNRLGLALGPLAFLSILLLGDLEPGRPEVTRAAAAVVWIALWWVTEAVPIPVTSLMPLLLFPLLGIASTKETAPVYMDAIVFLFLGGFIIALAIERWGLHRRIALAVIRRIGTSPRRLVLGFMAATALLSMWISNTATTMMMLPIGLAVIAPMEGGPGEGGRDNGRFATALLLGIAYAAGIGGIGTLIGTPPNIVLQGFLHTRFPECRAIDFQSWLLLAIPFTVVFLFTAWALLVFILCPVKGGSRTIPRASVEEAWKELGPMTPAERRVLALFLLTALLWIFRKDLHLGSLRLPGWSSLLGLAEVVDDSTVAVGMAFLLFLVPSGRQPFEFLMDWKTAARLPWGILLLFGGGLALARGMQVSGLTAWLGHRCEVLAGAPPWLLIVSVSVLTMLLTEVTSNTATANMILPVLATVALSIHINPLMLLVPATISASCAFMLPVATPPNTIVFGSGRISITRMAGTGVLVNLTGLIFILLTATLLLKLVFGVDPAVLPAWAH